VIVEGEWTVLLVNLGRPIVTDGDFVAQLCKNDALFPNYFVDDLFCFPCVRLVAFDTVWTGLSLTLSVIDI